MSISKQRTLDYVEREWRTYAERSNHLPKEEQNKRVKKMGFESFRAMLAQTDLVAGLPEDAFLNKDIESWPVDDVIVYYAEHPLPA
jgi:hypothetical protein